MGNTDKLGATGGAGAPTTWPADFDPTSPALIDDDGIVVTRVAAKRGPALFIIGLVALVSIGGAALALVGSGQKTAGGASLTRLHGVAFGGRAAAPILKRISSGGNPPSDVVRALVVPQGSTVSKSNVPTSVNLYSGTVDLDVSHSASAVATFFRRELVHDRWSILAIDAAASGNGTKIFAKIGSSDGYYWEVGVEVNPAGSSITPALGGGDAEPTSTVSLTVFEVDDAD